MFRNFYLILLIKYVILIHMHTLYENQMAMTVLLVNHHLVMNFHDIETIQLKTNKIYIIQPNKII